MPAKKPTKKKPAPKKPAPKKPAAKPTTQQRAASRAAYVGKYQAKLTAARRCIGFVPSEPADPARKAAAQVSLEAFARYFPRRFSLPWAQFHLDALKELEQAIRTGGQVVLVLPRGSGKTALLVVAVLWAMLFGYRRFVVIVAATDTLAGQFLDDVKTELETNDLLAQDFPQSCLPVRKLERIARRAVNQEYYPASEKRKKAEARKPAPTYIGWTGDEVTLATIDGAPSSGATVRTVGMTGAVRGMTTTLPDGTVHRPDLVLADDVQTSESAHSPTQTADRERKVLRDLLHLAGPTTKITCVMLGTVAAPNDLTSRFADRERHPSWRCVRSKAVLAMPANLEAWDRYAEHRRLALAENDPARINAYYTEHHQELEHGAEVSWPARIKDGDLNALQSAMHVYLDDPGGFACEMQGEPRTEVVAGVKELVPAEVARRLSGTERRLVPIEATRLTAGVDCGKGTLHWFAVTAWNERGGGTVIDYGCFPQQARSVFAASDARPSLKDIYPSMTEKQRVYAGLAALLPSVLGRTYLREGGGELKIERALVDAGYEGEAVYSAVRASPFSPLIYPSKGFGRSTTQRSVGAWRPREGERAGPFWRLTAGEYHRMRLMQFDADEWKSVLYQLLTAPVGPGTALTLFGKEPREHDLVAEHLAAEWAEPATLHGTSFFKWREKVHRPDGHLFDCVAMSAVAASFAGLRWSANPDAQPAPPRKKRQKVKLSEIYSRKHGLG